VAEQSTRPGGRADSELADALRLADALGAANDDERGRSEDIFDVPCVDVGRLGDRRRALERRAARDVLSARFGAVSRASQWRARDDLVPGSCELDGRRRPERAYRVRLAIRVVGCKPSPLTDNAGREGHRGAPEANASRSERAISRRRPTWSVRMPPGRSKSPYSVVLLRWSARAASETSSKAGGASRRAENSARSCSRSASASSATAAATRCSAVTLVEQNGLRHAECLGDIAAKPRPWSKLPPLGTREQARGDPHAARKVALADPERGPDDADSVRRKVGNGHGLEIA
jgi:hypothetical protein